MLLALSLSLGGFAVLVGMWMVAVWSTKRGTTAVSWATDHRPAPASKTGSRPARREPDPRYATSRRSQGARPAGSHS